MGLMQSLGRLWNAPHRTKQAARGAATTVSPRAPVAIDLHVPLASPSRADVSSIDRELTQRLGLTPAPLPSRQAARDALRDQAGTRPSPASGAAEAPSNHPVTGEILDPNPLTASDADHAARLTPASSPGHTNVISALLAMPSEARGRLRSKQQILDQLRDNYEEVLRVIRKVDGQLDLQQRRAERMLEIAEHTAHGRLPEIREETRKVGDAIDRLSASLARGQDRIDQGVATQIQAIERVQTLLTQLVDADRSLGDSLVEFRRTAVGMAAATERLGSALAGLQDRAQRRDEQIADALERSNRTMLTVLILSIVSAATAITMVVLAVA